MVYENHRSNATHYIRPSSEHHFDREFWEISRIVDSNGTTGERAIMHKTVSGELRHT